MSKTAAVDYLRAKSRWRADVAQERCFEGSWGQLKNKWYAESLEAVAKHVEALPDDDPRLEALDHAGFNSSAGTSDLHFFTIHCDYHKVGIDRWFTLWAEAAVSAVREETEQLEEFM